MTNAPSADATAGEGPTDAEFLTLVALELEGGCRAYVNTSHGPHNNAFDASDRLRAIASRLAVARSTPPAACAETVMKHRRHVELSPGVGADVQRYALAVLDDVLADIRRSRCDGDATP